jgi:hypothetical protein
MKQRRVRKRVKNLDVAGTSHDLKIGCGKGVKGESGQAPYLSSLCASAAQPNQQPEYARRRYRVHGTKYITVSQATNIIEAVAFAKLIGLPLVAHLTIHWAYSDVGDDPEGRLFAKFREGLNKWLQRRDIVFAGAWARERTASGQGEVVHCHLLFHLPAEYCTTRKLEVEAAIYRLIKKHGRREGDKQGHGYWADEVIKLVIHDKPPYPDGKYLIKGGGRKVWKLFRLRKEHRRLQGIIFRKRCGCTQNLGPTARRRAGYNGESHLFTMSIGFACELPPQLVRKAERG